MKLTFDIQVLQTSSRWRGMGRYTFNLLREFTRLRPDHQYVLLGSASLPPLAEDDLRQLPFRAVYLEYGETMVENREILTSYLNASGCDTFIYCSPFEQLGAVIPDVSGFTQARTGAILYDIIPAIFPQHYLPGRSAREGYATRVKLLTSCDFLLSISDCSRQDVINRLGVSPRVIGNIGGGVDASFYEEQAPGPSRPISAQVEKLLSSACILYLGGGDWRKNEYTLLEAYALLPAIMRARHPLVFTHTAPKEYVDAYIRRAVELGIASQFHHTGFIEDCELKLLYEKCHLFVFPSRYEGFGLPIAEAMVCGAPVVASDISSMPEVCGDAAVLIRDPGDPKDIAKQILKVLQNEELRSDLRSRSLARREAFRWKHVAERMDYHLRRWTGDGQNRARRNGSSKKKVALFTPLPPKNSGISDYIADLLPHLARHFDIDLFIDDGYTPDPDDERLKGFRIFSHRQFPEKMDAEQYDVVNHQLGSSDFHLFQIEWFLRYPSVVMLHDPTLTGLAHLYEARNPGRHPGLHPNVLMEREVGKERAATVRREMASGLYGGEHLVEQGVFSNEFVFRYADAVMMQTRTAVSIFQERPHALESAAIGYAPQPIPLPREAGDGPGWRQRHGISEKAVVMATFGIIHYVKQPGAIVEAFQQAREQHADLHLFFVGPDVHASDVKTMVKERGLSSQVHFTGHIPLSEFYDAMMAADIILCLRYPCQEQLSAALLRAMSCGKAVLASDVPSNRQLPDSVLWRIPAVKNPAVEIHQAMRELIANPARRETLGRAAREYIALHHDPECTASAYQDTFDSVELSSMVSRRKILLASASRLGDDLTDESALRIARAIRAAASE